MKPRLFEGQISTGWDLATARVIVPAIRKPDHLKSRHFCPDFKWFLTKWLPFVRISNGWAFEFQNQFEIQTICNPTSLWPGFQISTVMKNYNVRVKRPLCHMAPSAKLVKIIILKMSIVPDIWMEISFVPSQGCGSKELMTNLALHPLWFWNREKNKTQFISNRTFYCKSTVAKNWAVEEMFSLIPLHLVLRHQNVN